MSQAILAVKNLVRHFGSVRAVDDISFSLQAGQVVGFIGANGAGKTTTMRLLTTLDVPDSGEILYNGQNIVAQPRQAKGRIGWMPDGFDPPDHTTVHDYLDFFARAHGLCGSPRMSEVERILQFCGLQELRARYVNKLSKGQTQRLSLARTLIGNPDLLVMDEPAAGLDPAARLEFKQLVRTLQQQGKTIFISSHILSELAEMCDSLIFMHQGRIIYSGSCQELSQLQNRGIVYLLRPTPATLQHTLVHLQQNPDWQHATPLPDGTIQATFTGATEAELPAALRRLCQENDLLELVRHQLNLEESFVTLLLEQHEQQISL